MVNSEAKVSLTFVSYSLIFLVMKPFLTNSISAPPFFVSIPSISYFKVFDAKLSKGKTIIQLGFTQDKIVKLKISKHFSSIYYFASKRIYIQLSYEGVIYFHTLFVDPCIPYVLIQLRHFLSKVWMLCVRRNKIINLYSK